MHHHHHAYCGHGRTEPITEGHLFADDDFTQAAASERRARAAHAHGASLIVTILGGFLFFGVAKRLFGSDR